MVILIMYGGPIEGFLEHNFRVHFMPVSGLYVVSTHNKDTEIMVTNRSRQ